MGHPDTDVIHSRQFRYRQGEYVRVVALGEFTGQQGWVFRVPKVQLNPITTLYELHMETGARQFWHESEIALATPDANKG